MDQWAEFKPKTPKGYLPVLRLTDGTMMPESCDIALHVAKNGTRKIPCDEEAIKLYNMSQENPLAMCNPLLNWFKKEDVISTRLAPYLDEAAKEFKQLDEKLNASE